MGKKRSANKKKKNQQLPSSSHQPVQQAQQAQTTTTTINAVSTSTTTNFFPLLWLPEEIIELILLFVAPIDPKYFEDIPELRMSFARVIFANHYTEDLLPHHFDPGNGLELVGFFARVLHLKSVPSWIDYNFLSLFPNCRKIVMHIDECPSSIIGDMSGMAQLRILDVHIPSYWRGNMDHLSEWLSDLKQSGHVGQVTLYFIIFTLENFWSLQVAFNKPGNQKRIRILVDLYNIEELLKCPIEQIRSMLYSLEVRGMCRHNNCPSTLAGMLFGKSDSVLPQLQSMIIVLCCVSDSSYDFTSFTPIKFPLLNRLALRFKEARHGTSNHGRHTILTRIFSESWPMLQQLALEGSIVNSESVVSALKHSPNLVKFSMEDSAHVALHVLLPHFFPLRTLDITTLSIRYSPFLSTALHQRQIQQSCRLLTKLCIRNIKITSGLIKFIGDTPSLRFLMFYECVWDATILPKRKSVVSTTVWRIVFDIDDQYIPDPDYWLDKEPTLSPEVWIEVCLLFPNLKFISLMHCDDSSLKKVSAAFPNLIVSNRLYT